MNNFYMIPNSKDLSKFECDLILPLVGYSIGYDVYFSSDEIENIAKTRSVSVMINAFLHKDAIESIKSEIEKLTSVKFFFIEDLGLSNIIDKTRIVLYQNHIINNYSGIDYFKALGIENIVVSNELTISELKEIRENTTSNLFYFLVNRNALMYSKRGLVSAYYEHKGKDGERQKEIEENVSGKHMLIKEENGSTVIYDKNIFSANELMDEFDGFNFIINLNNMSEDETKAVLEHYKDKNLSDYISVDNYFIRNRIGYKVGEK